MEKPQPKVWFITGISSGFGKALAKEVINLGDVAVGTFRKEEQVKAFNEYQAGKATAFKLDVTHFDEINHVIQNVIKIYGRIDVLVNNAGFALLGAIEEISLLEARAQMETNFFGALSVTQHVLPHMRKQRSGHILQISSIAGIHAVPGMGLYNSSKFALEGFSESLALEVAPHNIKVTIIEPGLFRTNFGKGCKRSAKIIDDYATTSESRINKFLSEIGKRGGDPQKAALAMIKVVYSENPPLRLPLGQSSIDRIRNKFESIEKEILAWQDIVINIL